LAIETYNQALKDQIEQLQAQMKKEYEKSTNFEGQLEELKV